MFFDSWYSLGRILIVGVLAYTALIFFLRVSGKRTLTKMNAFDLVITVSLGSTLATVLLSSDVTLSEGLLAFALLIALQFVVTWSSVRFATVRRLVKSEPSLLYYRGHMLSQALQTQRVTPEEVRAAIRAEGMSRLDGVEAVVLETDGSFTIVPRTDQPATALTTDVSNYPPA